MMSSPSYLTHTKPLYLIGKKYGLTKKKLNKHTCSKLMIYKNFLLIFLLLFFSNQNVNSQSITTDDPFKKMFETKISHYHYGEHMMEHRLE